MDKNEFFREATLRICGNLEIEKALFTTLQFLREVMPADWMALEYYDKNLKSMQTIAMATPAGGKRVDLLTPLTSEAQQMAKLRRTLEFRKARLLEDPKIFKIVREMTKFHSIDPTSLLDLSLDSEGQLLGYLVLAGEGSERFTQKHAGLISMLSDPFVIAMSNALKHREIIKFKDLLVDDNRYFQGELQRLSGAEVIGANFGLKDAMQKVQQVASLGSPVLLLGETGTGKDVIANAIHYSSTRSDGPFVSVNCGAIPDTLIDSELFGHEKGAFTGALSQKRGRFERADKGTIFLDEIGELPLQAQVRLLKVLQSKEIERVGGVKTISLDIRIIAASNRNLEEMVKLHEFREDLWFRLNVFPIWIPPLRERQVDIPALIQHFISLKAKELKLPAMPVLSPGGIDSLMEYHWPGNVRELENIVERALILNPNGPLDFESLNPGHTQRVSDAETKSGEAHNLDGVIAQHIRRVLAKTKGKINGTDGAAAILGINPSTLRNRMKKLGINYGRKNKL
jgi:formate hydrogenlyase transcriptional activator